MNAMTKASKSIIAVKGSPVTVVRENDTDYISLTDIAKHKEPDRADQIIQNWMRNRNTVEFLGVWERLNNPGFKPLEFEGFRSRAGLNSFVLTPRQWIEATSAIGLVSKSGRYGGGTFAHRDIAFEFASWISVEFRLYLIKESQRLKEDDCAPDCTANFWKSFWIVGDALKVLLDGGAKFLTQAFALVLIPGNGIVKLLFRNAPKDEAAFHLRYFASSFALTSANETTSSGFSRWSWRRRSMSSASPGVSSCEPTM